MARADRDEESREFSEEAESIWRITFGPLVWAGHFIISYAAASVICVKFPDLPHGVAGLRIGLGVLTLVALGLIARIGWNAWHSWCFFKTVIVEDTLGDAEDRHRFLNHAAFLLAVVSFIGVFYAWLPAVFIGSCR